jgi:hypothetical protein
MAAFRGSFTAWQAASKINNPHPNTLKRRFLFMSTSFGFEILLR